MDQQHWLEIAIAVCDHAGIQPRSIEVVRTWETTQNTVYRLGDQRYLKLYHRDPQRQFAVEYAALQTLAAGGILAPRLIAAAAQTELPPYVFTTAVPGSSAEERWEALPRAEQLVGNGEFGAVTAAYHQLPHQPLAAVERTFGGGAESIQFERAQRLAEIEAAPTLTAERRAFYDGFPLLSAPDRGGALPLQRDDLISFITGEATEYFNVPLKFSHCDLSHAHLFVAQETGVWRFSGVIDWAEAMLVPPEWDLTYHWFWTFTRDQAAMKACLGAYFADTQPPACFARRCFAAILHTYAWVEIWTALRGEFARGQPRADSLVRQMTEFLFPPAVFGPPD
ncbi:MAG: phosphotransferase [Caldilineaceae bacterium]